MASPYDEFQQPAKGSDPYAEFQRPTAPAPTQTPSRPSIGQRALSNLPRSIGNLVQNAFPVQNEQLPIDPAQRHVRGPFEEIGNAASALGNRIMHPVESFANDPAGTIAIPAMAAAGGIRALGGPEAAISKMVPQTFNPIPHIGAAVKAAAPDVIKGGMKAGVGLTLAQEAPGMLKWPARGMLGYPGLRQMYKGMRAGGSALGGGTTEEALAALPEYKGGITNPEAAKMPAVFGDPQGFSKLPQSVQDAILKGQGNITQPKATAGPLPPRSREDYLGPDAPRPNTVTIHPEAGDLRIKSPQPAPAGTIPVPKPTVEGAVTKLDMPAHEPYESFSPSRVERQTTPAETVPARAEYEARVGRLKKAFPLESDQQIRTRADRAIIDKKLGAAGLKKQDFQSMGGK